MTGELVDKMKTYLKFEFLTAKDLGESDRTQIPKLSLSRRIIKFKEKKKKIILNTLRIFLGTTKFPCLDYNLLGLS